MSKMFLEIFPHLIEAKGIPPFTGNQPYKNWHKLGIMQQFVISDSCKVY